MITKPIKLLLALLLAGGAPLAHARVVINEIMYHAPDDLDDLQFIELHNSGTEAVELGSWAFTKGIKFKFAASARIEAKGFLVLCRNVERFQEFYRAPVAGRFESAIRHKGERVELTDASGKVVDFVKFKDSAPWPTGADGYSGSLERISPEAASDDPANWASSPLAEDRDKPAGTPGQSNAGFSAQLPPVIEKVKFTPEHPAPNEAITVEADVRDVGAVLEVKLWFRIAGAGFEQSESSVAMKKIAGHHYAATLPGQAAEQLIRFRIQATGAGGALRFFPAETEPRPALSAYVQAPIAPARIPFGWILETTEAEFKAAQQRANAPAGGGFGGFGPGGFPGGGLAPDPLAPARAQARTALERGLDLSWPWFEITVKTPGANMALPDLKMLFVAKLAERNQFIADQLAQGKTEEELQIRPEVIRSFLQGLAAAARPHLDESQNRAFAAWLAQAASEAAVPFATMINRRVDLEGAWHAVTLNAEIEPVRLAGQRKVLREFDQQRRALLAEIASGQGQDNGFRDQRDHADTLGEKFVAVFGPQLSPAQTKQLDAWRNSPREITVGLRAAPPMFEGPPSGFAGGPGGFGGRGPFGQEAAAPGSHRSAFVYFDPATSKTELFDFVQVTPRKGGQKIHLLKDQPLRGMTTVNLIFEDETASLVEPLAYEVYRRVGLAAEQSYHVRLWQSGQPVGYHLLIEQPNRAFLRRNQVRDDGNLYKLLWYENGVVGQHEKKTNTRTGHDDIVALIAALEKTSGDAQWEVIRKNFQVEQVASFFAVNTVLSHWDGFFNNYFTYHDAQGTGKWTMYPWDQDSTWGLRDMTGTGQVFSDMPITFGMSGDSPSGGGGWWRSPGWFSGPLLANPQFRKLFLARTKEILETIYTEEVFAPVIAAMARRLEPEVKIRAEILKQDPARATQSLKNDLDGALQHLRQRREFLLAQDEIKNAGKSPRTGQAAPAAH